jgi:periplasmic iron binding protein
MGKSARLGPLIVAVAALLLPLGARAAEMPIGQPVVKNGMRIGAVYLQPVVMAPMLPGMDAPADVHLEADIHAKKDNPNGFGPGDWIPYLGVTYRLEKLGTDWQAFGAFMAMTAQDGPHYGANVKLDGPGKYRLSLAITPPSYHGFFRHTDKETGVAQWWAPFAVNWEFAYIGTGKKGGY